MPRAEIEEEAEVIRLQGGEMPEVAFYESLGQLEAAGLTLGPAETAFLESAVVQRYQDLLRRDLDHGQRRESHFRGPRRAEVNWNRLKRYAGNRSIDLTSFRAEATELLGKYLELEASAVARGRLYQTIGLAGRALTDFMIELGLDPEQYRQELDLIATVSGLDFAETIRAARSE